MCDGARDGGEWEEVHLDVRSFERPTRFNADEDGP